VLLDAESRNGTLLNGTPIKRTVLKDGDEIAHLQRGAGL